MTATARTHEPIVDPAAVESAVRLIAGESGTTELRVLEGVTPFDRRPQTYSGYYDDFGKLAQDAAEFTSAKGFYITLNPFHAALLARSYNKIRAVWKEPTTADADILRRRWSLIDCDAKRRSGVASSDQEHEAALGRALQIRDELSKRGWPEPIFADSGNGGHLLYRVDLPRDDGGVIERTLKSLAKQFDNEQVAIDQTVFNPSRISRLYGCPNCKGDADAAQLGRPWRVARIFEAT